MANYLLFYPILRNNEGGFTIDDGGKTWRGISYNSFPKSQIWPIITSLIARYGIAMTTQEDYDAFTKWVHTQIEYNGLELLVMSFYKPVFWDSLKGDQINNQSIANFISDWCVNCGMGMVYKIQEILGVSPDGMFGPASLAAVNTHSGQMLFDALVAVREQHYRDIAAKNAKEAKYLSEWLSRTRSFSFVNQ